MSVWRVLPLVSRITLRISSRSESETRERSPTMRTRTPRRCTRFCSSLIARSFSSVSAMSAWTSSAERLKFSIDMYVHRHAVHAELAAPT